MLRNIERLNGRIYIAKGKYDKPEVIYLHGLKYAASNIAKVCSYYFLAEIYKNTHRIKQAKETCSRVVQNGGDLFYVDYAKNPLKNCNI